MSRLVIDFQKRHVSIDFRTAGLFTSHANSGIPFLVAFFDRFAHGILFSGYQNENALSQIRYSTLDHLKSTSISWPTKVHFHSESTKFVMTTTFYIQKVPKILQLKVFFETQGSCSGAPLDSSCGGRMVGQSALPSTIGARCSSCLVLLGFGRGLSIFILHYIRTSHSNWRFTAFGVC